MRDVSKQELHALKTEELGLDATAVDLTSPEAIACAIRRAARICCPCSPRTLIRYVSEPLNDLVDDPAEMKRAVEDTMEGLLAHGDLQEHSDIGNGPETTNSSQLIYATQACFVTRESGALLLIGAADEIFQSLPREVRGQIVYDGYTRTVSPETGPETAKTLGDFGVDEIPSKYWLNGPKSTSANAHLEHLNRLLSSSVRIRDFESFEFLDKNQSVRYYRGRWSRRVAGSGIYVARRTRAFGGNLWCLVGLDRGCPQRLLDFPCTVDRWRGCDEAWQAQLAIDAVDQHSQVVDLQAIADGSVVAKFFGPIPMWARRRFDTIGRPLNMPGALFAYRFNNDEVEEEIQYMRNALWLEVHH